MDEKKIRLGMAVWELADCECDDDCGHCIASGKAHGAPFPFCIRNTARMIMKESSLGLKVSRKEMIKWAEKNHEKFKLAKKELAKEKDRLIREWMKEK